MYSTSEPAIALRQIARARNIGAGRWSMRWQLDNCGVDPLSVTSVHLPHGQFKSARRDFLPALEVAAGAGEQLETTVQCQEPAGLVTENAFVIFHCRWRGESWRVFARVRVNVDGAGEPHAATELITTQKAGFSGISN